MAKLTILRGVSGSGKSTWAELQPNNPVIVSRDRIRMAMFGTESFIDEDLVTKVEHDMIRRTLRAGRNCISDNTNIMVKYIKQIVRIAEEEGASYEIKTFNISLADALSRNAARAANGGRDVPKHVIEKQHGRLSSTLTFEPEPFVIEPYVADPKATEAILVDIDGTAAHMGDRRGPFDWLKVGLDEPDKAVRAIVNAWFDTGRDVIFFSGRDGVSYGATADWLEANNFDYDYLYMREAGDMRPDDLVKYEMFNEHIRHNFNIVAVIDDRAKVVRMWKRLGLKVFNVAGLDDGEF
jgi:predicted kinase